MKYSCDVHVAVYDCGVRVLAPASLLALADVRCVRLCTVDLRTVETRFLQTDDSVVRAGDGAERTKGGCRGARGTATAHGDGRTLSIDDTQDHTVYSNSIGVAAPGPARLKWL